MYTVLPGSKKICAKTSQPVSVKSKCNSKTMVQSLYNTVMCGLHRDDHLSSEYDHFSVMSFCIGVNVNAVTSG